MKTNWTRDIQLINQNVGETSKGFKPIHQFQALGIRRKGSTGNNVGKDDLI
jgi:hypothetical protein